MLSQIKFFPFSFGYEHWSVATIPGIVKTLFNSANEKNSHERSKFN